MRCSVSASGACAALSATTWPSLRSWASQTRPNPPEPSLRISWNRGLPTPEGGPLGCGTGATGATSVGRCTGGAPVAGPAEGVPDEAGDGATDARAPVRADPAPRLRVEGAGRACGLPERPMLAQDGGPT